MSDDKATPPSGPAGIMDYGTASEETILAVAAECARAEGPAASWGDWKRLETDGLNTQIWLHAPTGKINGIKVIEDGSVVVRNLRPGKGDRVHPKSITELMSAGLIKYARDIPTSS